MLTDQALMPYLRGQNFSKENLFRPHPGHIREPGKMARVEHQHDRHGILWQTWTGEIKMDQLVQLATNKVTPETDSPIKCAVSDFRPANFSVAPAEVWKLVETYMDNPDRRRGWRWAILANQPDHVGLATLFQHRGQNISMEVEVFATEDSAVAWLLQPRDTDA